MSRLGYALALRPRRRKSRVRKTEAVVCRVHALGAYSLRFRAASILIEQAVGRNYPKWSEGRKPVAPAPPFAASPRVASRTVRSSSRRSTGAGAGKTGRSISRPIGTITTLDRWAIVDGHKMRMMQPLEILAAMGFPSTCKLPPIRRDAVGLLGNAYRLPPVVTDLLTAIKERLEYELQASPRRFEELERHTRNSPIRSNSTRSDFPSCRIRRKKTPRAYTSPVFDFGFKSTEYRSNLNTSTTAAAGLSALTTMKTRLDPRATLHSRECLSKHNLSTWPPKCSV